MTDKPNVLLFMLDQVPGHVLRPDSPCRTPNIDRIIERGVRVDRAYTPSPICTPARASLMTGLLPHNHGATQVHLPPKSDPLVAQLHAEKVHWAQRLNDAGYQTGHWGKWHVDYYHNVNRFGWEQWDPGINLHPPEFHRVWTVRQPNPNPGYPRGAMCGPTDIPLEERSQWRHYEGARRFLDLVLPSGDPWACALSFSGPHSRKDGHIDLVNEYLEMDLPLPASRNHNLEDRPEVYRLAQTPFRGLTDEDHRKIRACHYASVEEHDRMFGLVMDQVEEAGQMDNTIVLFVSDHGDALGAHGIYTKILFSHEPVYNIPMVLAGPGVAQGCVTSARVGLQDLCPTLLELTGCEPIDDLDGRSAASLLADPPAQEDEWTSGYAENYGTQLLFTQRLHWDGDWKLVYNGFGKSELYNLAEDPDEMTNRIDDPEVDDVLERMARQLWRTARDSGDREILGTPPCFRFFPYGPGILNE
jgi:arylsulfatase A-like enzyme